MIQGLTLVSINDIDSPFLLKSFDCGIIDLNEFLSKYAKKNHDLGIGRTFVALDSDKRVAGFFTLSAAQVAIRDIPLDFRKKLPRYPVPALRLARLAVSKDVQGKGVGKWLLKHSFIKAVQVAEITGLYFLIVDAKETSKSFYEHYGFTTFSNESLTYFLPISTIKKAIETASR